MFKLGGLRIFSVESARVFVVSVGSHRIHIRQVLHEDQAGILSNVVVGGRLAAIKSCFFACHRTDETFFGLLHLGELRSIIPRRLRIMWRYHGVTKKGAAFIVQANKPNLLGIYVIKRLRTMASKV